MRCCASPTVSWCWTMEGSWRRDRRTGCSKIPRSSRPISVPNSQPPGMLEVRDLSVSYGGLRALQGVSLDVAEGQFVTVVGPNGAGKTTLFKAICGVVPPALGTVSWESASLLSRPASARAHLGIAHVPEGRQVFRTLTVRENLEMGAYPRAGRAQWARMLERIHTLFPILAERAGQLAGTLSGGEQQMLAIGRGVASAT